MQNLEKTASYADGSKITNLENDINSANISRPENMNTPNIDNGEDLAASLSDEQGVCIEIWEQLLRISDILLTISNIDSNESKIEKKKKVVANDFLLSKETQLTLPLQLAEESTPINSEMNESGEECTTEEKVEIDGLATKLSPAELAAKTQQLENRVYQLALRAHAKLLKKCSLLD